MGWLKRTVEGTFGGSPEETWRVTMAALGGLLAAILVAGLVGFLLNRSIERAADEALRFDVEIEDDGDDLRAAVLEVRHYHRNLYFQTRQGEAAPTRAGVGDFEAAYADLLKEISEYNDPGERGAGVSGPREFRRMAEEYHDGFRPALDAAGTDKAAFTEASDLGLRRIADMEASAAEVDELGERLSTASLQRVDRASATATVVLLAAVAGLLLAGAALSYAAVRVVNELRRLYAEQRDAAEKLEEAARHKTEFLADVSHELRTPLTVLRGNAQLGLALSGGTEDQKEVLEEIVEESKRMSRIVEDLLLLTRSDAAGMGLEKEVLAVKPLVEGISSRAAVLARERGASLETDLQGEGLVEADAQRVSQAALILVDNAAKYGGGELTLSSRTRSGEFRLTVSDRGPGIPKEELPRVFERFYRLDKARSRALGGTGLGLPIARTIAEAHGGRIEAVSRTGEGTRMSICLPLLQVQAPPEDLPHGSTAEAAREPRRKKLRR